MPPVWGRNISLNQNNALIQRNASFVAAGDTWMGKNNKLFMQSSFALTYESLFCNQNKN